MSTYLNFSESTQLLELINALTFSKSIEEVKQVLFDLQDFIGCEHIILGTPAELSVRGTAVNDLNISYPQEWVDLYQAKEFWRIDPVVLTVMSQNEPQYWQDVYLRHPPEKKFLSLAHDFGMEDGLTCLSRDRFGHRWTIISLAGNFKERKAMVSYVLSQLSPHLHIALSEIRKNAAPLKFKRVTKREREVLKWLLHGKTSWEISVILNVAEATINFHVQNIKTKLNVVTRSQAVATALHNGLITL